MKERYFKSSFRKRIGTITIVAALAIMFAVTGITSAVNEFPTASISGMKFNDLNTNGIKDPGEPGLSNWTITLSKQTIDQESPITTQTDDDGNYSFTGLFPGNYAVEEVMQPGWVQTEPGGAYNIVLNRNDVTGVNFGNYNSSQPGEPYLFLMPNGLTPDEAEQGSTVGVYGRNFCPTEGCSEVRITIGNDFVGQLSIAKISVDSNGLFRTSFIVNVPVSGDYIVNAMQTTADGRVLIASQELEIEASDRIIPEIPSPDISIKNANSFLVSGPSSLGPSSPLAPLTLDPAVTEFPPNVIFGGRGVAVDVSSKDNKIAIVASESGGLWKTTDNGNTWSHLDGLIPFAMADVKFAPGSDQIVIATTRIDSLSNISGGIWLSTDGGNTWNKPPTTNPRVEGWGISFAPGTNDVYAGTNDGVYVSHDSGSTWNLALNGERIYGVNAQKGATNTIVDVYGSGGFHRSTDGGSTWTPFSNALPPATISGVHSIVGSPFESNVIFAVVDAKRLYESDDGGNTWNNLNPTAPPYGCREPWTATYISSDGDPNHFDIYFGNGVHTYRETCTNTGPGLRCPSSWNLITTGHGNYDQNGIAFDPTNNCPQYIVDDGGIEKISGSSCGANWYNLGSSGGYHALQIAALNGQVHPDHTDLYFGTQDNYLWASGDNGATWPNSVAWEGYNIQNTHDSPTDSGQTIVSEECGPCSNFKSDAHFSNKKSWNNPLNGNNDNKGRPFIVDQGVYIQWASTPPQQGQPPVYQLYFNQNTDSNPWTALIGGSTTNKLVGGPIVSGPSTNPIVYQRMDRSGGVGLFNISGLPGSVTMTSADSGLNSVGSFGVDPNNPQHLIAADKGTNRMMVSNDGGASWNPNVQLTNLITNLGQYLFRPNSITFDITNTNRILVGTYQAGFMASLDGGTTWSKLPGSEVIPDIRSVFFDQTQQDVIAASYGRGLWKLDLSPRATTISYTGDTTQDYHDVAELSGTLIDKDSGQPIAASVLKFEIGTQSCTAKTDASGNAACSIVLDQIPGPYNVVTGFAGSGLEQASTISTPFTITKEETTLSYTGDTLIANKFNANMSGVLLEDGTVPISGRTVTFTLGTGATAQTCQGTTDNTGTAKCTISPVNQPLGPGVVSDSFAGDTFYLPSNANATTLIFAFPDRGVFVIGDKNSSTGAHVTYWSSIWSTLNLLSGGAASDSFKGFASDPSAKPPACGATWEARPGDSEKPPDTVPSYMGVLVSSKIGKSGSTISGDIPQIVVITTDPGYGPNPGHPGTGTEIATFCKN